MILLVACSPKNREWQYHENRAHLPHTASNRLILYPELGEGPFELELIRTNLGTRMYLNICRMEAPPHPDYPKRTSVELFINNECMTVHPYILSGGQRLLFSDEIAQLIIETLLNGQTIELKMGYRKLHIVPANFNTLYDNFIKLHP